jgi:electron transfer flavoprotein beta subunit
MKIIVCLKEVIDPALNLDFGLTNKVVFREGLPLTLNPSDAAALAIALDLKSADNASQSEIILISIGSERVESYLRNGLALGADKAVRIHEEDAASLFPNRKAQLLAGVVSLLGADLIFTGTRSLDTASGQVGLFIAARLGMPCVTEVIGLEMDAEKKNLTVIRDIGRGEREKVRCPLPAVIAVKGEGKLPYASLEKLIESKKSEITVISPEDIGISPAKLKSDPTRVTGLLFPRPDPRNVPPLDSSLPAFYRILQLLEGGIAKRKGLMLEGSGEEIAERLFILLKEEGILKSAAD